MNEQHKRTSDNECPKLQSSGEILNDKIRILSSAKSARDEIQKNKKMREDDRLIFARNLGKIYVVASKRDDCKMKKYFEKAFGDRYESQYKKKRSYVQLPGSSISDTYYAHSLNYLKLAKAMSTPITDQVQDAQDNELRAILRLVEGSSFDNRQTRTGRLRKEQETQLVDKLEKVVSRVVENADMAGYLEIAKSCSLGVPPEWPHEGDLSIASGGGWGPTLEITKDAIFELRPRLGPSIQICEIRTPAALAAYALVQVPKARIEHIGLADAVSYSIYEALGLTREENISEGDYLEVGDDALFEILLSRFGGEVVQVLRELNERDDNLHKVLASLEPTLETRIDLHLQIRFDPLYEKWKPALTLQNSEWGPISEDFITEIRGGAPIGTLHGIFGLPYNNWAPFVDLRTHQTRDNRLFIVASPKWIGSMVELESALTPSDPDKVRAVDERFYKSIHGLHQGTFVIPGQEAINFLIEPLDPTIQKIDFKVDAPEKVFTGFVQYSLADAIFRNLSYAASDKQIDTLLLADARDRASKLRAFVDEERAKFEDGLSRFA